MKPEMQGAMMPEPVVAADGLFAEASAWYFRLQAEDVTQTERLAFADWLAQGEAQEQAWQEVQLMLAALREPARQVRVQPRTQPPGRSLHRFKPLTWACAAAVVLALGCGLVQSAWPDRWRADYATQTGQTQNIQLSDGSTLQLNTDSAVQVSFSDGERRLRLLRGEAWFSVTKDVSRPFYVSSGEGWVRVVGTQFSVRNEAGQTWVKVAQGRVAVSAGKGQPIVLEAGQAVEFKDEQLGSVHAFEPLTGFAWRQRQLVFSQQPLAAVVAELNRYWPGFILIRDAALQERVVSGVFDIDKPEAVFKALSLTLNLNAKAYTPYLHVLSQSE